MSRFRRRDFIRLGLAAGSFAAMSRSLPVVRAAGGRDTGRKVIVLGFDGMDPGIVESMMAQGKLPAFSRLANQGDFRRLQTSLPAQSPVAWSNFITGMDPGGHGIFDFIHRDPKTYFPYLSTSRVEGAKKTISIGDFVLPVSKGEIELLRKGKAFWQILEEHDIPATVVQIPSNFPPAATKQRTLSGMGTPDVLGTYGIFNFYTTQATELKPDIGGGKINLVRVVDNVVEAAIPGPRNSFKKQREYPSVPFKVFLDPSNPVAKIVVDGQEFLLKEKEWSGWKHIRFPMIPTQSVPGICTFYLKQLRPEFKLYVSPVNIDPASPVLPISTPAGYSKELEAAIGPFFTKGLPADTMAVDHGVLTGEEFIGQDEAVLKESIELFEYELKRFEGGLWFHYFSCTDQRQHMFLGQMDKKHPHYDPSRAARAAEVIETIYADMDRILARAMEKAPPDTTLMVMSDHGFTSYRRSFNLNTWLLDNGYLRLLNPYNQEEGEYHSNTDWSLTRAYALGINGLYLNLKGREGKGIVEPGAPKEALIRELVSKLQSVVDPSTGEKAISTAFIASEVYHGPMVSEAPDILVGYNRGYRASWATPLGRMPKGIFEDNTQEWGADHCMDPAFIPGILLMNRKIKAENPALYDLTATILKLFDIETPPEMVGRNIL